MWALRRRLSIVGVVIAFFTIVVVFPYMITHREVPSCTDGKQNQGEEGLDCGGPCAVLCHGKAKDLNILWTKVFPIRTGEYDVASYIENPNFEVGIQHFTYTTQLYDATNEVIATRDAEGFARPSERFVLFSGGMLTGEKIAKSGSIQIHPDFDWVKTTKSATLFSITDKQLIGADQKPKLTAIIHDLTPETYRDIDVAAVIYDSKNNPIGVSNTRVEKIEPGSTENIIFTWPHSFDYVAETESCETPVDVVLSIDRSGSMREENKIGQAKTAAEQFIDRLGSSDQAALETFATNASDPIDQSLTDNKERLKRAIATSDIHTDGLQFTNIAAALRRSIDELSTQRHNPDSRAIILLLTDGIPNRPSDPNKKGDEAYAGKIATDIANEARAKNIAVYTIGLGSDVNTALMQVVATKPDQYYQAASGAELTSVYQQIATAICKKSPSVIEIIPRINNVTPTPQTP